ncbi:MAG: flagellar hook-basal body complex protein [Phycisphaerales bacterium]|nr:MAG: flagellar hook-basal body complex protein [Phycisphaerales bacterium]
MSLTTAMFTGFTGIKSNSVGVDTVGDNLANLNTTAFKGQRTLFETLLYRTLSEGEGPGDSTGGTLPRQVGTGSNVATIQRSFAQGGVDSTGFPSDLAIDGRGFFVVAGPNDEQMFTRDGAFRLDANETMVSSNGAVLQIFPADESGQIRIGTLSNLVIPLGSESEAIATTNVVMDGRLDSTTNVAAAGALVTSQALVTSTGTAATASTQLIDLVDANGLSLFAAGDELVINGSKGDIAIPEAMFVVGTDGSTLGDLGQYMEAVLGINSDPATGGTPGITVSAGPEPPEGALVVNSNLGEVNAIELDASSIVNRTGAVASPFSFTTATEALGGGETTSFNVFDSLGNAVEVRLRVALESKSETGTTWRFYAESVGDSDLSPVLGTGTITFDPNGQFVASTGTDLSIDRAGVGAETPLTFALDLSPLTGLASTDGTSELIMDNQNGAPAGLLIDYAIDADGIITGMYSNQLTRVFGQVALATFINDEGLLAQSENVFLPGVNSGDPTIIAPRTGMAGEIRAGYLEQSNVELAREFINLIGASTGISSASRVVRAADDLLQELLLLAR